MPLSKFFRKTAILALSTGCLVSVSISASIADEIKVGQGILPPYGIKESASGIEVDIVRAALKVKGHTITVRFVPFGRVSQDFIDGKIDAANTVSANSGLKAEFSNSHITYQNVATTLKGSGLTIQNIGDMANLKVVAFSNASKYLGDEFAAMTKISKSYREVSDQIAQNKLLMSGRTQVVVGDYRIFQYYTKKIIGKIEVKDVTFNKVFEPTDYSVAFRNTAIRDDFNAGLKAIRESGEYDKIIEKYVAN